MHKEKSQQRLTRGKRIENQPVSRSKTSSIKVGVSSRYRVMKATTGYRVRTEEEGNKLFGGFEGGFPLQSVFPSQHRASHQTDFLSELVL